MFHAGLTHVSSCDDHRVCELFTDRGMLNSDAETVKYLLHILESEFETTKITYYYQGIHREELDIGIHVHTYLANFIEKSVCLKEVELVSATVSHSWCWHYKSNENVLIMLPAIFKAIQLNSSIETLKLVNVGYELIPMLEHMKHTLTHLSIQNIEGVGRDQTGDLLPLMCCSDSTLTSLDLTLSYGIVDNDLVHGILQKKTALKTLILKHCKLHEIPGVVEELKRNTSLRVLDLSANYMDASQTTFLFQVFKHNQNTTLQTLDVSDSSYNVGDFKEMLTNNTSLHCLSITVTLAKSMTCVRHHQGQSRFFRHSMHPSLDPGLAEFESYKELIKTALHDPNTRAKFSSTPGVLAYVDKVETIDSVCHSIISALKKNTTLQKLIIHTLFEGVLVPTLVQSRDYDEVKNRIQVTQSNNRTTIGFL